MLQFPYVLDPDAIGEIKIPDYPVKIFTASQGVEFLSLDSCVGVDATLELLFNTRTSATEGCPSAYSTPLICEAWNFYRSTFGVLLSFEIPDDHPLWFFLGDAGDCFKDQIQFPNWRFAEQPKWEINGALNIWNFKMTLINKPGVNG